MTAKSVLLSEEEPSVRIPASFFPFNRISLTYFMSALMPRASRQFITADAAHFVISGTFSGAHCGLRRYEI